MKKYFKAIQKILNPILTKLFFIQTTIILLVVYTLVLGPIAIIVKLFSINFFQAKGKSISFWKPRKIELNNLEQARRLF